MDKCPHEQSIRFLEQRDGEIVEWMKRLEGKLDALTSILVEVKALEGKNVSNKEALDRAFKEIQELKDKEIAALKQKVEMLEAAYNQSKGAAGMLKFALPALWVVLGGAVTYLVTALLHL